MTILYVTTGLVAALAAEAFFVNRLFKKRTAVECVIAVLFAALALAAYLAGADAIASVYDMGAIEGVSCPTWLALALEWGTVASTLVLALWPFFRKKVPAFGLLMPLALLFFVADAVFLQDFIALHTGPFEVGLRPALYSAQVGFGLGYALYGLVETFPLWKSERHNLGWIVLSVLSIALCTAPNYTLQLLFSPSKYAFTAIDLNLWHRILIYPAAVIPIAIYLVTTGRQAETKRLILLYYGLAALVNFMSTQKFPMIWGLEHVGSWPLHLCNTACYVLPLCLTFKLKRVFYFTYFINVFGAFLALTIPNYSTEGLNGTILVSSTWHFYRAHYQAFFMPLLCVGMGVFARPRLRQFIYSMVGFLFYYLAVLCLNAFFTNFDAGVDFFFINSDFVADKLGTWAERLRDVTVVFTAGGYTFKLYPVYQSLYFLVYCLLALAMWFLYELAFRSVEGWKDLAARRKKIRMDALALSVSQAKHGGDTMNEQAAGGQAALSIQGFSKRYGRSDVYAVKDAFLDVHGGEIFGFLGPNGAGKSTIIKSIVGIQPITEGKIFVCGHDVEKDSVGSKLNIGFVPDHYALYEKLTAREYVNYIADLYRVPKAERDERMQRYVEIFELQKAVDDPISTYSHGMKQKVAIMAALIHNPKVWILDEPLTGLDPNSIFQVKECMKRHAAEGNVVFFSSHLIDVVERVCDRIAIIRKGQLQCVEDVKDIESRTTLEKFYMDVIGGKEVKPVPYTGKPAKEGE